MNTYIFIIIIFLIREIVELIYYFKDNFEKQIDINCRMKKNTKTRLIAENQ